MVGDISDRGWLIIYSQLNTYQAILTIACNVLSHLLILIHFYRHFTLLCCTQSICHVQLFVNLWTVTHQALVSIEFPRQEYCSGLPFPPPGAFPDLGTKAASPASSALAGEFFTTVAPGKP